MTPAPRPKATLPKADEVSIARVTRFSGGVIMEDTEETELILADRRPDRED
jgi:hypothetical protein